MDITRLRKQNILAKEKVQVEKPEVQPEEKYEIVEEDTLDLDFEYILSDEDIDE